MSGDLAVQLRHLEAADLDRLIRQRCWLRPDTFERELQALLERPRAVGRPAVAPSPARAERTLERRRRPDGQHPWRDRE